MKVRISLLISVLSHVSDAPDTSEARSRILRWILDEADRTGGNKHRIRRNLIWSNFVRGTDATSKFAHLVWDAAANQNHDPLVDTVRAKGDEQALRDHLTSLAPTPSTIPSAATLSAAWIERQVVENNLDRKLTSMLLRRSHMEYEELRSLVGYSLARWGAEGRFDEVLEAEGTVSNRVLIGFLRGKVRSHHYRRGQEPLERMRGARTETEVAKRRETGDKSWSLGSDKTDTEAFEATPDYDDDGKIVGTNFIDNAESPEDSIIRVRDAERHLNRFREVLMEDFAVAGPRLKRVFNYMAEGMSREEISQAEGVSSNRAAKLTAAVRDGIRKSIPRDQAKQVLLNALEDEPFSTLDEIEADTEIEAEVIADCLKGLIRKGVVTEFRGKRGDSYVLTRDL